MSATIRTGLSCIAVKIESTAGTDAIAGTPAASDYVSALFSINAQPAMIDTPQLTGAYDRAAPTPGSLFGSMEIRMRMVGSGAAGTAPEFGRLLQICRMVETVTAAAVGAPTAATAATSTTATGQAPFGTTSQQYRGMPILLAGNPAAGATDVVLDYTTGRVVTLSRTYSPVLSTSTTLQIPVNVLYAPTSDESAEKTATIYAFRDGLRWKLVGCRGSFRLNIPAGGPAQLVFQITGQVSGTWEEAVSLPTNYTPVTRQPPRWAGGVSQLNRSGAAVASLGFDAGVRVAMPENPEATDGFDIPITVDAAGRWTLDPFGTTSLSPARWSALRAGTEYPISALWGSTAGNRFSVCTPAAVLMSDTESERNGLRVDQLGLMSSQPNAGVFIAHY